MFIRRISKPGLAGLASAAMLAAAIVGCGGQPTETSDSVVLPSPDANVGAKGSRTSATSPGGATAASAPAAASATAPSASGGTGGWGTFKGQVVFDGAPPAVPVLQEKGKAAKDPNVCAADGPILNERLVVDAATKGVKNVLVYFPRPSAVNEDAKKAVSGKSVMFDQKKCVFEPHVLGMTVGETVTLKSSDPLNHNVNIKLKQTSGNSAIAGGQSQIVPAQWRRAHPGHDHLRYPPLDERVVDGHRQSLYHRHRRKGKLRDQERAGGSAEGRGLAGIRQSGRLRDGPFRRGGDDQGGRYDRPGIQDRFEQAFTTVGQALA